MRLNNKGWLLWGFVWIITVIILAPANCAPDTTDKNPAPTKRQTTQTKKETPEQSRDNYEEPECSADDDCPSDSDCLRGFCVITDPTDDAEETEDEFDAGTAEPEGARYCVGDDDCGCGYQCDNDRCNNATDPFCCANAECGEDEFCHFGEGESNPNGTCMKSECDTSENCEGCGMRCYNHLCKQRYCCTNNDCSTGQRCAPYYSDSIDEHHCVVPECTSDADCGCGKICDTEHYNCTTYNPEGRYMQCCGTDFYYNGECVSHESIEDGRCLDDSHCPAGKVCYAQEMCLPATCTKNSDCGCESVCREGGCEYGCDRDSDCCNSGDTCDRGDCINLNIYDKAGMPDEEN